MHYHNPHGQGTYGKLACTKSLYMGLNGYDVKFPPMGKTRAWRPVRGSQEVGGGPQHLQRPDHRREEGGPGCGLQAPTPIYSACA